MEEKETTIPAAEPVETTATEPTISMAEHEATLAKALVDGEVRYQLARMGARNPALAAKALDLSGVTVEGETVGGVEALVKGLMASDPYLFGSWSAGGERSSGAVHGEVTRDPDTLSDREYYAMKMRK